MIFRIRESLNHIHLPVFIIHKVNVIIFRQFLALNCLSKLKIWLNYNVFLISLLVSIVSSLNHAQKSQCIVMSCRGKPGYPRLRRTNNVYK